MGHQGRPVRIEGRPEHAHAHHQDLDLFALRLDLGRDTLGRGDVDDLAAIDGVSAVYPRMRLTVPALASIAAGLAYTAGPRPIAYSPLGELFVLLFFGVVCGLTIWAGPQYWAVFWAARQTACAVAGIARSS